MKSEQPHPGITMHQIKVGGGFMGLVFTLGSAAIFLLAIPALWAPVLGSLVLVSASLWSCAESIAEVHLFHAARRKMGS